MTVRAAAVNYTKHENNNTITTITTITQRRKQRKRKKRFCERENKNGINKNNPNIRDNIKVAMITVKCRRRRQWRYTLPTQTL